MTSAGHAIGISYNFLNLPIQASANTPEGGSGLHQYLYDAGGTKLRSTVNGTDKEGKAVNYVQDYVGGIEYKDQQLAAIYHSEGRICFDQETGGERAEWCLKDHLGNTRVTFSDVNGDGEIEVLDDTLTTDVYEREISQENHYYPFGMARADCSLDTMKANRYLYNGKELDTDFGLNWYHYGARMYDPSIGRFTGVDPISDQFAHLSTFNYASNDPVRNVDLHGLQGVTFQELWNKVKTAVGLDSKTLSQGPSSQEHANSISRVRDYIPVLQGKLNDAVDAMESIFPGLSTVRKAHQGDFVGMATDAAFDAAGGKALGMLGPLFVRGSKSLGLAKKFKGQELPEGYELESLPFDVDGQIFSMDGNSLNGTFSFIIDELGSLKLGVNKQGVHYSLSGGAKTVKGAGQLNFNNGTIIGVNNSSGHYPIGNNKSHTETVLDILDGRDLIPIETRVYGNQAVDFPSGYNN